MREKSKWGMDPRGMVNILRAQTFSLESALLELIDNAIDEDATTVSIVESENDLVITDNGNGFDDIRMALELGMSMKVDSIGRYGVGLKSGSVKFSDATLILSNGYDGFVDWNASEIEVETGSSEISPSKGSVIRWINFRNRYKAAIQRMNIRKTYSQSLNRDLRISINGDNLDPLPFPEFIEKLDHSFSFNGMPVRVYGGIIKSNDPQRKYWCGYNIFYRGRLIGDGKIMHHGTGDSGCTNFSFIVTIEDGESKWELSAHKDELVGCGELLDYIYTRYTRETLHAAAEIIDELELAEFEKEIDTLINGHLRTGNITRGEKVNIGQVARPTGEGAKKRRTNTATREGSYQAGQGDYGKRRKTLGHRLERLDGTHMCEIQDQSKRQIVILNTNNPFIDACVRSGNRAAIVTMILIGYAIYKESCTKTFNDGSFVNQLVEPVMARCGDNLSHLVTDTLF